MKLPDRHRIRLTSLALSVVSLLAGCEEPFEPLATTDLVFSISGYLDATADTQWVRVMPFRESVPMPPDPIDAVVTLEEIETGTTVVMNDSLARYVPVLLEGAELYAHNFWTTMPMVPGRHYRLTATRSDGASATAAVLVPTFEGPTMEISTQYINPGNPNDERMSLPRGRIQGTRHLAMVFARSKVASDCPYGIEYFQEYLRILLPAAEEGGFHDVQMVWGDDRPPYVGSPPACRLEPRKIFAIAAAEVWPFSPSNLLRDLSHLSSFSNIEDRGVGFLAGVHTHVFPYAECTPMERARPCTITFSPRSATLLLRMSNRCTGQPAESMAVAFVSPPTNASRRDGALLDGIVKLEGLEPDLPHILNLSQFPRPDGPPDYAPREVETAPIEEGGTDTVHVELVPIKGCGL